MKPILSECVLGREKLLGLLANDMRYIEHARLRMLDCAGNVDACKQRADMAAERLAEASTAMALVTQTVTEYPDDAKFSVCVWMPEQSSAPARGTRRVSKPARGRKAVKS